MTDLPTVYDEVRRRARKEHTCCECRQTINKGDPYFEISGLWEDRWCRFRQCEECHELFFTAVRENDGPPDEGPSFGDLRGWLFDTDEYMRLGLPGGERAPREA